MKRINLKPFALPLNKKDGYNFDPVATRVLALLLFFFLSSNLNSKTMPYNHSHIKTIGPTIALSNPNFTKHSLCLYIGNYRFE